MLLPASKPAAIKESAREERLKFSEEVEIASGQIVVKGPNDEIVSQGTLRQLADNTVAIDIKPFDPGNYVIQCQALTVDTHITDGTLRFSVLSKGK